MKLYTDINQLKSDFYKTKRSVSACSNQLPEDIHDLHDQTITGGYLYFNDIAWIAKTDYENEYFVVVDRDYYVSTDLKGLEEILFNKWIVPNFLKEDYINE